MPLGPEQVAPGLEPAKGLFDEKKRSFATARVVFALVLREMSTSYGRSPGGYLWAILEPIGMILILSIGFSLLVRTPSLGNNFILFYASGYLVFSHYRSIEQKVSGAIKYSRRLLYFPAVTWLDAITARVILNTMTNTLNAILIFGGIVLFTGSSVILDLARMIEAYALATLLAVGVGTLNCLLSGLFPLWATLWKMAMKPLMIASAILYIFEDLPQAAGNLLWWNPLVHLTGLFRSGVYPTYHPQYISELYVLGIGIVTLAFGLLFLNAYNSRIVNQDD